MDITKRHLEEMLAALADGELIARYQSGEMTELAAEAIKAELQKRRIDFAALAPTPLDADESVGGMGNLILVATFTMPTEAHILRACLEAGDVPAVIADEHLVQAYSLGSSAIGGVRVLVPKSHVDRAREIIDAYNRGEYALDEDADIEKL